MESRDDREGAAAGALDSLLDRNKRNGAFAERCRRLQAKLADEQDMVEEHSGKLACTTGAQ